MRVQKTKCVSYRVLFNCHIGLDMESHAKVYLALVGNFSVRPHGFSLGWHIGQFSLKFHVIDGRLPN